MTGGETYAVLSHVGTITVLDNPPWSLDVFAWPSVELAPAITHVGFFASEEETVAVGTVMFGKVWRRTDNGFFCRDGSWSWKYRSCATPEELAKADFAWADFVNNLEEAV